MFKIKQKIITDSKYNVIRCEEYQGDKLIYWENNRYTFDNRLLEKETNYGIYNYKKYPHTIKYFPYQVAKYITITVGFTNNLLPEL